jgi:hypothetical protein
MSHFSRGRAVNQSRRRFVQTLSVGGGAAALGLGFYPLRKAEAEDTRPTGPAVLGGTDFDSNVSKSCSRRGRKGSGCVNPVVRS